MTLLQLKKIWIAALCILICNSTLFGQNKGNTNSATTQNRQIENKKEEQSKLQENIRFLDKQIKQTQKSQKNTINELRLIQQKAQARKKLIDKISQEIASQEREIESKNMVIAAMQKKLDTLTTNYKRTIYKAYQNRDSRLWFMHILSSDNIAQAYRRWSYLKNYTRSLNSEAHTIIKAKENLETEKKELSELKEENQKMENSKREEYNQLKKDESTTQQKYNALSKQQNQLKKELQEKKQQAKRLENEIQKMISSVMAKNKTATGEKSAHTATPESVKLSSEFEGNKGRLPWPVKQGVVVEPFGENPHPTLKGVKLPFNNGINISAPRGCSVLSVFDGVVKQIIFIPGYNNCILVEHGGYFTFYCKLGKVQVKVNQKVTRGQILGTLDNSAPTSELHFEIWHGNKKQNPANWLKQ